jgi:hypothetical protein
VTPVLFKLLSLFRHLTPGDAAKDFALSVYGYWPALLMHIETGLLLGLLNLLLVAIFRGLELRHRMKLDRMRLAAQLKKPDEAE